MCSIVDMCAHWQDECSREYIDLPGGAPGAGYYRDMLPPAGESAAALIARQKCNLERKRYALLKLDKERHAAHKLKKMEQQRRRGRWCSIMKADGQPNAKR